MLSCPRRRGALTVYLFWVSGGIIVMSLAPLPEPLPARRHMLDTGRPFLEARLESPTVLGD